jgi:redox-sensitive bicupin YhaK (pirin superfamily)
MVGLRGVRPGPRGIGDTGRMGAGGGLEVRRAADRFLTVHDGITTHHCFSFGDHYDPANVRFESLLACNDEVLEPGAGYAAHRHRAIDIVTWVIEGTLAHEDSTGNRTTVRNGTVQHLTAGTGVTHSELNGGGSGERLRFVQLWFDVGGADGDKLEPAYETWTLDGKEDWFGFTAIAGSDAPGRCALVVPGVTVRIGHLPSRTSADIPRPGSDVAAVFVYVATGCLQMPQVGMIHAGDAVTTRGRNLAGRAVEDTVVVLVEFTATARGR